MAARGTPFKGILFAGLMVDGDNVNVIEYNVRLGDPETQILLPLMEDDILEIFLAAAKGDLASLGKNRSAFPARRRCISSWPRKAIRPPTAAR